MKTIKYNCGCSFPLDENDRIVFDPTFEKVPLDCQMTWDLICSGDTKGVFQLESHYGRKLSKDLAPRNILQLSDLTAVMRPGCSESFVDGKNLTTHYIDRKHGRDPVKFYHPALEPILKNTFGILVYQEQAMQIAQAIAGFNLLEADNLRKAIGKKKPEEMAKVKTMFLEKATALGIVTETEAIEIFSWIEKSQRYSFNKSHGVAYAVNAYISAYAKAHFTKEFYTSYLVFSENEAKPSEEVRELVSNAKRASVDVYPPDIRKGNNRFRLYDDIIYTGLSNIKGIGQSVLKDIREKLPEKEALLGKQIEKWSWLEFMLHIGWNIKRDAIIALISTGALAYLKTSRRQMLYEYEKLLELTDRDVEWLLKTPGDTLIDRLKVVASGPVGKAHALFSKKKKELVDNIITQLEKPPYSLEDTALWISEIEQAMLGVSLTCSKVDDCDSSSANCTCKDFLDNKGGYILIACQVEQVKVHAVKNGQSKGQNMAFIVVSDSTCTLDSVICFPKQWETCRDVIMEGTTVILGGNRDKKNKDTLVVSKAWAI
jgi:DNA polymerase-3 subunit alpha